MCCVHVLFTPLFYCQFLMVKDVDESLVLLLFFVLFLCRYLKSDLVPLGDVASTSFPTFLLTRPQEGSLCVFTKSQMSMWDTNTFCNALGSQIALWLFTHLRRGWRVLKQGSHKLKTIRMFWMMILKSKQLQPLQQVNANGGKNKLCLLPKWPQTHQFHCEWFCNVQLLPPKQVLSQSPLHHLLFTLNRLHNTMLLETTKALHLPLLCHMYLSHAKKNFYTFDNGEWHGYGIPTRS